jgi:hypothetical protein
MEQYDSHIWEYYAIKALGSFYANDNFQYGTWLMIQSGELTFDNEDD